MSKRRSGGAILKDASLSNIMTLHTGNAGLVPVGSPLVRLVLPAHCPACAYVFVSCVCVYLLVLLAYLCQLVESVVHRSVFVSLFPTQPLCINRRRRVLRPATYETCKTR